MQQSAALKVQPDEAPTTKNGTVVTFPGAPPPKEKLARRSYLTEREVEQLSEAARSGVVMGIVTQR
jgi:hypothetical protein